jgi:hypothetical protein
MSIAAVGTWLLNFALGLFRAAGIPKCYMEDLHHLRRAALRLRRSSPILKRKSSSPQNLSSLHPSNIKCKSCGKTLEEIEVLFSKDGRGYGR